MCPQIYSLTPISIDRANLSNISKNNAYPIILLLIMSQTQKKVVRLTDLIVMDPPDSIVLCYLPHGLR